VRVSTWVWAKSAGFTQIKARKDVCVPHFQDARGTLLVCLAHEIEGKAMPEAHDQYPRRMGASPMC